jgi:uncharacterized membrane protein YedE/YeeE
MRFDWFAFACGLLFATGLGIAGMIDPNKVLGFLDVAGAWDPSVAAVMLGAMLVYAPVRGMIVREGRALGLNVEPPVRSSIDRELLLGAVLFGIGWGITGYCPGPAVVAMGSFGVQALVVAAAMFAGMRLYAWWERR